MLNFVNENENESESEFEKETKADYNTKLILTTKYDIMMRYIKLRKIAISYWDIFSFSFSYCLIFPTMQKLTYNNSHKRIYIACNIISSLYLSYFTYRKSLKYILKVFNKQDYDNYKMFCKKYKLDDDLLL